MRRLTFTNANGESVEFSSRSRFIMNAVEGLGEVESERHTERSYRQDGATTVDILLEERDIAIDFSYVGRTMEEVAKKRREVSRIMNPRLGSGQLRYEDDSSEYVINVDVDHMPTADEEDFKMVQSSTVQLTAPNPYWMTPEITTEPMDSFQGKFILPFKIPFKTGMQGSSRVIDNTGDVACPIQVEFQGPSDRPEIRNNRTGEYILIEEELEEGDTLTIDTTPGNKHVRINGDNALNWMERDSTFFQIEPGENEIQYLAYSGSEDATVTISYRFLYVAI